MTNLKVIFTLLCPHGCSEKSINIFVYYIIVYNAFFSRYIFVFPVVIPCDLVSGYIRHDNLISYRSTFVSSVNLLYTVKTAVQ